MGHFVLQALLELLHNILKQTSSVVRAALQVWAITGNQTKKLTTLYTTTTYYHFVLYYAPITEFMVVYLHKII